MDSKSLIQALGKVRELGQGKKFKQTFDFIVNLKNLDIKKQDDKVDIFVQLPHGRGKPVKICAFVDDSLVLEAKKIFDNVVEFKDFPNFAKDKRRLRKLARDYDFFVAQANLMPQIAQVFGKFLGPKGRMPNPKVGCVIPPKIALQPIVDKLKKTVRLITKSEPILKCPVGIETMSDKEVSENILAAYNAVMHALPQKENNLKSVMVKLTMGAPVKVEAAQ